MNAAPRPLEGLGVVITRPLRAAEALAAALEREGARPYLFPALAIEDIEPSAQLEAVIDGLDGCDLAIFVSAHAVEKGLERVRERGKWPPRARVAAIGEATAQALRNSGFEAVISPPERHDSEALLAQDDLKSVAGRNIVIFRGLGGREALKEALESRGAHVTYAECYRRTRPAIDPGPLLEAWSRGEVHAVSVLSAETLENFIALIGARGRARLATTALVVPHEAVASREDARRFSRVLIAAPGAAGITRALAPLRVMT